LVSAACEWLSFGIHCHPKFKPAAPPNVNCIVTARGEGQGEGQTGSVGNFVYYAYFAVLIPSGPFIAISHPRPPPYTSVRVRKLFQQKHPSQLPHFLSHMFYRAMRQLPGKP
jgi:hypothetical protein